MTPSPLWFATRGTGAAAIVLATLAVCLGVLTRVGWRGGRAPRFVTQDIHRNVSLLVVAFGAVHVITSLLDPFARLGLKDALVPFASSYRPTWLGLGVVSAELLGALVVTSLLRGLIGHRAWRLLHWTAYASWPVALLHSLGTGSDAQAWWMQATLGICAAAVLVALAIRLSLGWPRGAPLKLATWSVASAVIAATAVWAVGGPLHSGWARVAGTPEALLKAAHQVVVPRAAAPVTQAAPVAQAPPAAPIEYVYIHVSPSPVPEASPTPPPLATAAAVGPASAPTPPPAPSPSPSPQPTPCFLLFCGGGGGGGGGGGR